MDIQEVVKTLPLTSGVYLMKDEKARVIYIGKAISLRKRVQSYFRKNHPDAKTRQLVERIVSIQTIDTQSEAEALILEASLVRQYRPKYNIDLKDNKSYPLIQITKEEFPRISIERPRQKRDDCIYYGPYVNATLIREALKIIRRIFHFRTCENLPSKECLYSHIGLCVAPCVQKIGKREYVGIVKNVKLILEGEKDELYKRLTQGMEKLSQERKFEEAAKVRDQLRAIGALYSGTQDVNYYKEAEQLQRALGLTKVPERIEAFDISNTMGTQTVASMVSFFNGKPDKANYRRFKIKTVDGIDDFKSMGEVVRRRYSRLMKEKKMFPDLILIDGGKGQLSAADFELKKLGANIPLMSLAKREEEVFLPGKRNSIILDKQSLGLKLLQRVRDEAHRFAVTYHRKLRDKKMYE